MKGYKFETDHTIIMQDNTGFGKTISFNNHPSVPLYTVTAERIFGKSDRLVGRYSKLEDAISAYEKIEK